jgi:biopolymer transport protein ExbB
MKTTHRIAAAALLAGAVLTTLPATAPAQEQPAAAAPAEAAKPPKDKTLLDAFNSGGPLMYPLLLCSMGTLAVAAYCFINISGKKMMPPTQVEAVGQSMRQRDASSAYQLCHGNPNVFANTMSSALLKVDFDRPLANKLSREQAAGEALANEETKLNLWVNYLNVFATISPMLGLLGTVTGMITSFDMLAAGKSEPSDLAGGIGVAMITTATGLIVGIPAMFFFFYFRSLLAINIAEIQKRVTFMLDVLSGELKIEGASAEYEQPAE